MAIALVQNGTVKTGSSFAVAGTTTLTVTAGNTLVAFLTDNNMGSILLPPSANAPGISDSKGNTWVKAGPGAGEGVHKSGYPHMWLWYATNCAAGSTVVTVTGGGNYAAYQIVEFSGIDTTTPYDSAFDAYDDAEAWPGTSVTISSAAANSVANALVIAGYSGGYNNAGTGHAASGYTELGASTATHSKFWWGYKTVSSSATQSATITWTGSEYSIGAIFAFSEGAGTSAILPKTAGLFGGPFKKLV